MKKFFVFLLVFVLCGCNLLGGHRNHKPSHDTKPTPKPQITPLPNVSASIVNSELKIGNKRALSIGLYDLVVNNRDYPDSRIPIIAKEIKSYGFNLIKIWGYLDFDQRDLDPWVYADGKYWLAQPNETFYSRLDYVVGELKKVGVITDLCAVDYWSIRRGSAWNPLNPDIHVDPYSPKIMESIDWNCSYTDGPRQRWPMKCQHEVNCPCSNNEIGGRKSPIWEAYAKRIAAIAKKYGAIISLSSEQGTDWEHGTSGWDLPAIEAYNTIWSTWIRSVYPQAIIKTCVSDQLELGGYKGVGADLHGIGIFNGPCNTNDIASSVARVRKINPNAFVCINTDGCWAGQSDSPRFHSDWLIDVGNKAYAVKAYPEFICKQYLEKGLIDAARNLSNY